MLDTSVIVVVVDVIVGAAVEIAVVIVVDVSSVVDALVVGDTVDVVASGGCVVVVTSVFAEKLKFIEKLVCNKIINYARSELIQHRNFLTHYLPCTFL